MNMKPLNYLILGAIVSLIAIIGYINYSKEMTTENTTTSIDQPLGLDTIDGGISDPGCTVKTDSPSLDPCK